jgi:hypothetical protein
LKTYIVNILHVVQHVSAKALCVDGKVGVLVHSSVPSSDEAISSTCFKHNSITDLSLLYELGLLDRLERFVLVLMSNSESH